MYSEDAMEYSKEFVTAVVLGKDLVPRYLFYWIKYVVVNFQQYYQNSIRSVIGLACPSWRVLEGTFWRFYKKVTNQR